MQRLADRVSAVFVPVVIAIALGVPGRVAGHRARPRPPRSPPRSRCSSSPARARWAWPPDRDPGRHRARPQPASSSRDPRSSSRPAPIDTIVLDKTGTVTTGTMFLADAAAGPGEDVRRPAPAGRRRRGRQRAPGRRGGRGGANGSGGSRPACRRRGVLRQVPGARRHRRRRRARRRRGPGRLAGRTSGRSPLPRLAGRAAAAEAARARPPCSQAWDGAAPRRAGRRRHDQAHLRRGGHPAARHGPAAGAAHRCNERAARFVADAVGIGEVIAGVLRRARPTW